MTGPSFHLMLIWHHHHQTVSLLLTLPSLSKTKWKLILTLVLFFKVLQLILINSFPSTWSQGVSSTALGLERAAEAWGQVVTWSNVALAKEKWARTSWYHWPQVPGELGMHLWQPEQKGISGSINSFNIW